MTRTHGKAGRHQAGRTTVSDPAPTGAAGSPVDGGTPGSPIEGGAIGSHIAPGAVGAQSVAGAVGAQSVAGAAGAEVVGGAAGSSAPDGAAGAAGSPIEDGAIGGPIAPGAVGNPVAAGVAGGPNAAGVAGGLVGAAAVDGVRGCGVVRRVGVTDPVVVGRSYDYADAFEVYLAEPDATPPKVWLDAGMANAPAVVGWINSLLDRRKSGVQTEDPDDWQVVESTAEVVHLESTDPLMHAVVVCRTIAATRRTFTTAIEYRRPVLGRLVWAVVRFAHRLTARRVITTKVASGTPDHAS